jgi:predicted lysophospholipase L1 biosynthesis ABC-type transport system permease subunit
MDSNCKALNSQCLQSVRDGLVNTNTQLVARQIGAVGLVGAALAVIIGLSLPFIFEEHKLIPIPIKLDPSQISAATAAASATEIVVVPTSGPPVTITPKPNPPTVTG